MKKNTVITFVATVLLCVFLIGMNAVNLSPAEDQYTSDTIGGWTNPLKVVFMADGVNYQTVLIDEGSTFGDSLPEVPDKGAGYENPRWQISENVYLESDTTIEQDMTVTAEYDEAYPAMTLTGSVNDISVEIEVPADSLPVSTQLEIENASVDPAKVKSALGGKDSGLIKAVKLNLVNGKGETIQPLVPVTVNMTVSGFDTAKTLSVVQFDENGNGTLTASNITGSSFSFSAASISTFAVTFVKEASNLESLTADYNPGSGAIVVIKENQTYALNLNNAGNGLSSVNIATTNSTITVWEFIDAENPFTMEETINGEKVNVTYNRCYIKASNGKYLNVQDGSIGISADPVAVIVRPNIGQVANVYNTSRYEIVNGSFQLLAPSGKKALKHGNGVFAISSGLTTGEDQWLYVMDVEQPVKVSFNANGGNAVIQPITKMAGSQITLPKSAGEFFGYEFMGWAKEANAAKADYLPGSNYTITEEITLYAVWQKSKIATVRFYDENEVLLATYRFEIGKVETIPLPGSNKVGVRENLKFAGWSKNKNAKLPDKGFEADKTSIPAPSEDLDLYEVWYHKVTVTFEVEDAVVSPATATGYTSDTFPLSNLTVTFNSGVQNELEYWKDNNSKYNVDGNYVFPTDNATVTGVLKEKKYTVSFNLNGGNGEVPSSVRVYKGAQVLMPEYNGSKEGYVFLGWCEVSSYTSQAGNTYYHPIYEPGSYYKLSAAKNVTLYATWSLVENTMQGVKFGLRLDGVVPVEPSNYNYNEYSTNSYGYDRYDVNNPGNVYRWGVPNTQQWIVDTNTDEVNIRDGYWKENNVTRAVDGKVPTVAEINGMLKDSTFDPETQYVVWYVMKFQNYKAQGNARAGDPKCEGRERFNDKGECLDDNGKPMQSTYYGRIVWNIDGVIVNRETIGVTYEPGLPESALVKDMPASYRLTLTKDSAGNPIPMVVKVGGTSNGKGGWNYNSKAPNAVGYIFEGWYVKGGDQNAVIKHKGDWTITGDITFVAKWREPSVVTSSVAKVWKGDDGYNIRPDSITVYLYENGQKSEISKVLTAVEGWTESVSGLPQYDIETADTTGNRITYTWREETDTIPELYNAANPEHKPEYNDLNNATTITNTFTPVYELEVTKTADKNSGWEFGQTVTYTITVTNKSNVTISGLTMLDELAGVVPGSFNTTTIEPQGTATATATYVVTQDDVDRGSIYNKVTVSGADVNGKKVEGDDDETVMTISPDGVLAVEKTANPASGVKKGDTVTYTVKITNPGKVTVKGIGLTDTLVTLSEAAFDLAPAGEKIVTYTYTVTEADIVAGKIDNTVTAAGKDPKNKAVTASDDAEVIPVAMNAELTVEKTAAEPTSGLVVGNIVNYTVVITNSGNVKISDIKLTDTLVTLSEPEFDLETGASKTVGYTYTVTQADVNAGKIENTATAKGKDPKGSEVKDSDDAVVTTVTAKPALSVEKSANPKSGLFADDSVTYTVVVSNTGNVTITGITLSDTLVTLNEAAFDLEPEGTKTVTYNYTVTQADVNAGTIHNVVTASGKDPKNNVISDSDDEDVTTISPDPKLTLVKSADPKTGVKVGDIVKYTITVTNDGNVTISGITLSDTKVTLSEPVFTLAPEESKEISYNYTVTQDDVDAGVIENTASATGTDPKGTVVTAQDDEEVTTIVRNPVLEVTKSADKTSGIEVGNLITYTVTVKNAGNVTISDIVMTDTLVTGLNEPKFTLAPGGSHEFTYTYTATQDNVNAGKIDNTVTATGQTKNGQVSKSADCSVTTVWDPALSITKTEKQNTADYKYKLGETVTYTIVVTNTGPQTLTNIKVTDAKTGLDTTIDSLAPNGGSQSFDTTYTVKLADVVAATIENTVNAEGKAPDGGKVTDSDNETVETEKITIKIKAASGEKVYDGSPLTNEGWEKISGDLADGNTISSVTVTGSQTDFGQSPNVASNAVILNAGNEDVSGAYIVEYEDGTLKVTRKPVTVTADDLTKIYGDPDPTLTAVVGGVIGNDKIEYSISRVAGEDIDTYTITPKGEKIQGNYEVSYYTGSLEITPRPLTITADSGSKVYDGSELTVRTWKSEGLAQGDEVKSVGITGSRKDVGTSVNTIQSNAVVIHTEDGRNVTGNYQITYYDGKLTIEPQTVIVKADDKSKTYGDDDPVLTATVTGLIGSDTVKYELGRAAGENVGTYVITPTGEKEQGNYIVSYETGNLKINPKPLTITAGTDTKVYDGTPLIKNTYHKTDLAAGDSIASVTITGSQTNVGKSANVPSDVSIVNAAGESVNDNYTVTYIDGELEVTKLAVTITAGSDTKVYDGTPLVKNSYSSTDLAKGDSYESVTVTGSQTLAGRSPNVASNAKIVRYGVDVTSNYEITYKPGELVVTQNQSLVITAKTASKEYDGTPLSLNDYTYAGIASGDRIESVTISGERTLAGSSDNVPSSAKIVNTAGVDVTESYAIIYRKGSLTVTPKPLTITAADAEKVYDGTELVKNAYVKTALADGDEISTITVTGSRINVGKSDNTAKDAVIKNKDGVNVTDSYAITYIPGTLEVTPKALTITAGSASKVYDGKALTENSYTSDGLAAGDSVDSVTVTGSRIPYGKSDNVPSDAKIINKAKEDVTGNYTITYTPGSLTVTKKPVTITAESDTKVYDGEALVKNSVTHTDLADGDSIDKVTVTGSQTKVGKSENTASEAKIINTAKEDVTESYEITYVEGSLKVTPKTLNITAEGGSKVYDGTALTKNGYTYTELAKGDHIKSVTISGSQTEVGISDNTPSMAHIVNGADEDVTACYAIGYSKGKLEVTPKAITITADNADKVYDGTALTKNSYKSSALASGDSFFSVTVTGSQTIVGKSANVPSDALIVNSDNKNVTSSYTITYVNGTLEVKPKAVTITAASNNKVYDGTALTDSHYSHSELAANDRIDSVDVDGSQTIVGVSDNKASGAKIVNAAGEDVTKSYKITYVDGKLEVTPKDLTITAVNDEKVYDGTALENDGYESKGLASGDSVASAKVSGSRIVVGTSDNVAGEAKVVNSNGDDVTASYTITYVKGTLTVTQKPITVTADSAEKVYDGIVLQKNSYTGKDQLASGDSFSAMTVTGSQLTVGSSENVPSGAKIVNGNGLDVTSSYSITYVNGSLVITQKPITITAGSAEKIYDGTALTKNSYTSTALAAGDKFESVSVTGSQIVVGKSDNVPSAAKIINALNQDVTASYNISYVNGALEVTPKTVTITAGSDIKVYDASPLTKNSYTNSALASGDSIESVEITGSQTDVGKSNNVPAKAKIVNRNGVEVTSSYSITYVNGSLEVTRKPLTITANSDTKAYDGTALVNNGYKNSTLAVGDSISSVAVDGSQIIAGKSDNVPSNAVIVNKNGVSVTANYDITYINGTLEVTRKPVTITAASDSKMYDGTELKNTNYTNTAIAQGDSISSVAVTGSQIVAGSSDNVPANAVITNANSQNVTSSYDITYVKGKLEVTKKPLTITAGSASKIYDARPLTSDTYTHTDLAAGDEINTVEITGSQTNVGSSYNVASNAKIIDSQRNDVTDSYDITYAKGLLEVTLNQSVIITAASDTKIYDGTPLINSGYTSTALAGNDRLVSVFVKGSLTKVGSMPNIPSAAVILNEQGEEATSNYEITYVPGTLTVTPRSLTIIAGSRSKVYDGKALAEQTYKFVGLAEGDNITSVTITGSQTFVGSSANVPSDAVIQNAKEEVVTGNYTISYTDGELTVTKKEISITAESETRVYDGTELSNDSYSVSELAEGDRIESVKVTGGQTNVGSSSNVPSEAVIMNTDGKDVTDNYDITYVDGTLTVTPKPLIITALNNEKVYDGTPLVKEDYINTAIAEGDSIKSVKITGSQTNVGRSENVASDAVITNAKDKDVTANYEITYVDGTLTVTAKSIIITVNNDEKVYDGTALISSGYTSSELASGDSVTDLTITGSQTNFGSSAAEGTDAVIRNNNGEDVTGNYEITYVEGTLTVTKRPIRIIINSAEKVYDGNALSEDGYTISEGAGSSNTARRSNSSVVINSLANGHSIQSVTVTGSRTNVGETENVGSNAVIIDAAGNVVTENYNVEIVNGKLKVTPKIVYVTADDQTKEYGQFDAPFTAEVSGVLNNDSIEYEISREPGEEPGSYQITPYGEEEQGNYTVIYIPGTLVITYNATTAVASKIWVDDENRDGIRPVSLAVTLYGSDGSSRTRRLNDSNSWTVTIDDLPIYFNDEPIEYYWTEENVEGYTSEATVNGNITVFTNTHEVQRTSVSVNKIWDDMDNAVGIRPASLSVRLQSNGVTILGASLNESNGWSVTVNNLPLYENGSPIEYSWSEQSVTGYYPVGASISGSETTFTNSNLYSITIHYRYNTGEEAAADYTAIQPVGMEFSVESPVIKGYVANRTVVEGTQPAENIEFTVIYTPDGSSVITPTPVAPTPVPTPTPDPVIPPYDEPEPEKEVPEPRVVEPDEEHPIVVEEPSILVDIDDLETALGLGEVFINNGGYAIE